MISGAQSQVPAVALSGPNAVISRRTFSPPVSIQNLERYTFNIVPDRDVVPRLDDLSQNYQRIKCRSGLNDPLSCHFGRRSMCEVLLQCGSKGRPIPCHCITDLEDIYADSVTALSDDVTDIRSVCSAKNQSGNDDVNSVFICWEGFQEGWDGQVASLHLLNFSKVLYMIQICIEYASWNDTEMTI